MQPRLPAGCDGLTNHDGLYEYGKAVVALARAYRPSTGTGCMRFAVAAVAAAVTVATRSAAAMATRASERRFMIELSYCCDCHNWSTTKWEKRQREPLRAAIPTDFDKRSHQSVDPDAVDDAA